MQLATSNLSCLLAADTVTGVSLGTPGAAVDPTATPGTTEPLTNGALPLTAGGAGGACTLVVAVLNRGVDAWMPVASVPPGVGESGACKLPVLVPPDVGVGTDSAGTVSAGPLSQPLAALGFDV